MTRIAYDGKKFKELCLNGVDWHEHTKSSGIWCGGDCSACAVKDEGCWSLKPGERILFEAH